MKKVNKLLAALLLFIFAFPMLNSCKKDTTTDPINLLKGAWNLSSGASTQISASTTYTYTYNGTIETINNNGSSSNYSYTEKIEFLEDNIFKYTITENSNITSEQGFWAFMAGYDIADEKCLVVRISAQTVSGTTNTWTGDEMPAYIFKLTKLTGTEATIGSSGSEIYSSGTSYTYTSTKNYTKQ